MTGRDPDHESSIHAATFQTFLKERHEDTEISHSAPLSS